MDIIVFALIAVFLIYRLNSVLGTRHGEERQRPNPYTGQDPAAPPQEKSPPQKSSAVAAAPAPAEPPSDTFASRALPVTYADLIDSDANADGKIEAGLEDIHAADAQFDVFRFMDGAGAAFEMIVTAYAKGDLEFLEPLLSPRLYADFKAGIEAREAAGHTTDLIIHRLKSVRIVDAHLGGAMAYITVDYDVEETTSTRDAEGTVVEGDPDRIFNIKDIWTFTRDLRSTNPNWILIETRAADQ